MGEVIEFSNLRKNSEGKRKIKNDFSEDLVFFVKENRTRKNFPIKICLIDYNERLQAWNIIADIGNINQMIELRNKAIKEIMMLKEEQKNSPIANQSK